MNAALRSAGDYELAIKELARCGLPRHVDPPKNWDSLLALGLTLECTRPQARVLDAGAAPYSMMLPWLYMFGYGDLWGIDPTYDAEQRLGPITYERGDITRTRFSDDFFDVVTCLSVIEHGVNLDAYFAEASRILRPGGLLVTSTDFWTEPVDTGGRRAYGAPIVVFGLSDMEAMLAAAATHGLEPIRPLDLRTAERVVEWREHAIRYTFVNFALRAEDAS